MTNNSFSMFQAPVLFHVKQSNLPAMHTDRLTLSTYQDEHGEAIWHSVAGTLTDSKGVRWQIESKDDSASLEQLQSALYELRHNADAEFSVKYELLTIRG